MRIFSLFFIVILVLSGCSDEPKTPEDARKKLSEQNISFTPRNFINYVKKGDIETVKIFQLAGMPLYTEGKGKNTSLMIAVSANNQEMVEYILQNTKMEGNYNPMDRQNKQGKTAIALAIESGDVGIVETLLKYGANPNLWDENFDQGVHLALKTNNYEVLKKLLEYKITDINGKNGASETPLMVAVKEGKEEIAALLLENNADPNIPSIGSVSPLLVAAENENLPIIKMLLKAGANPNTHDVRGKTPLIVAVQKNNLDIIDTLLFAKADVNFHKVGLKTPLQVALSEGNVSKEVLFALLANGAEIPEGDIGAKVVSEAISNGDMEVVQTLAETSDIEKLKLNGETLTTYALKNGTEEIAFYFMKRSDEPNQANTYGETPLELAVQNEYIDSVEYLISKGTDVTKRTKKGYRIFDLAFKTDNVKLVKMVLDAGAEIDADTMLLKAILDKKEEMVSLFLDKGAKTDLFTNKGQPLVWLAAAQGMDKAVQDLIKNGAEVDTPDRKDKMTPLAVASAYGYPDTVKVLLQNKADPNAKDLRGYTPLTHAILNLQLPVIQMLLKGGADVNVKDVAGRSLFDINNSGSGQKWRTYKGDIEKMLKKAQ